MTTIVAGTLPGVSLVLVNVHCFPQDTGGSQTVWFRVSSAFDLQVRQKRCVSGLAADVAAMLKELLVLVLYLL